MKRRKFTQTLLAAASLSSLPVSVSLAAHSRLHDLQESKELSTTEGLKLLLIKRIHPTGNRDKKQLILTYNVKNNVQPLEEKIYDITVESGKSYQLFMTPVAENQLQAVFNRRINA